MMRSGRRAAALATGLILACAVVGLVLFGEAVESSFQERVRWSPTRLLASGSAEPGGATGKWISIAEEPGDEGRLRQ